MEGGAVALLVIAGVGLAAVLSWLVVGIAVGRARRHRSTTRPGPGPRSGR